MDGFQAYGAGKAGGTFDPLTFLTQPQTVVRILCWLFSMVVLGCVANEGYVNRPEEREEFCIFNQNQNACNYAVATGTLCFLCCAGFLALDVYFPQISGVKDRKKAVVADIAVSGFWSFMWFIGFCLLSNQWQVSKAEFNPLNEGADAARAAILFCFCSVFTWAAQGLLAFQKYRLGADSVLFDQDYVDPNAAAPLQGPQDVPEPPEYTGYNTDQQLYGEEPQYATDQQEPAYGTQQEPPDTQQSYQGYEEVTQG